MTLQTTAFVCFAGAHQRQHTPHVVFCSLCGAQRTSVRSAHTTVFANQRLRHRQYVPPHFAQVRPQKPLGNANFSRNSRRFAHCSSPFAGRAKHFVVCAHLLSDDAFLPDLFGNHATGRLVCKLKYATNLQLAAYARLICAKGADGNADRGLFLKDNFP